MSRTVVVWKVISLLYDQGQGDTGYKFVFGREKQRSVMKSQGWRRHDA